MKKLLTLFFFISLFLSPILVIASVEYEAKCYCGKVLGDGTTCHRVTRICGLYCDFHNGMLDPDLSNSSLKSVLGRGFIMMNNSQNLLLDSKRELSTQSFLTVNLIPEPYRQIMETCAEVQKIPTIAIMNSSNTQRPDNDMVQWRQHFNVNTMNSSTIAATNMFSRGATVLKIWPTETFNMMADECTIKKANSLYSFSFSSSLTGAAV